MIDYRSLSEEQQASIGVAHDEWLRRDVVSEYVAKDMLRYELEVVQRMNLTDVAKQCGFPRLFVSSFSDKYNVAMKRLYVLMSTYKPGTLFIENYLLALARDRTYAIINVDPAWILKDLPQAQQYPVPNTQKRLIPITAAHVLGELGDVFSSPSASEDNRKISPVINIKYASALLGRALREKYGKGYQFGHGVNVVGRLRGVNYPNEELQKVLVGMGYFSIFKWQHLIARQEFYECAGKAYEDSLA